MNRLFELSKGKIIHFQPSKASSTKLIMYGYPAVAWQSIRPLKVNYIAMKNCLRSYSGLIFVFILFFCQSTAFSGPLYKPAPGPYIRIIISGKPNARIIIPAKPSFLETYSASELQKYLRLISGGELPILNEGTVYNDKFNYSFFIGKTRKAAEAGTGPVEEKMGHDGFELKSLKDGIIIQGINELSPLFGVYELLERFFDVRWFMPGETGEYYPLNKTLQIGQINLVYKPSFAVRWISTGEWSLHQRMNAYVKVAGRSVGINWKWGYHTYGKLIPPEIYYSEHPEYFALVKGKRTVTLDPKDQGNQLCTTNPDVIREIAKNLIDTLAANPGINIINFSPDDNQRFCECENCRALDEPGRDWLGRNSNRFAVFNNEVAKIVKEKYPDVLIKVGAYEMYARPPLDKNYKPENNILFQVCHLWFCHNHPLGSDMCKEGVTFQPKERFLPNREFEKILDQWLKLSPHLFIYEYYQISGMTRANLPWPVIHTMRSDIPYYRNKGIEGFYTQTSDDWSKLGLNFYVAAKLCWNADLNVDDLIDDYFDKFYGPAAKPAKDYFMTMEKAMQDWNGCASYGLQGVGGLRSIAPKIFLPPVMGKMGQDITLAEKLSTGDKTFSGRVAMMRKAYTDTGEALKLLVTK
jgi:hypothetical protein